MNFKIESLPTLKDKIKQPPAAEADIIPRINSSALFIGASGSGKSTLLVNLLNRKEFLKGAFDRIFLFSPTGKSDDIQKHLELDDNDIFDDLTEAPDSLQQIMDSQRTLIETQGANKAPRYCIVYDDVIGDRDLMKSSQFVKSFIACRHYNLTTFLCSQSYTSVPRRCRLQATNIFYFKGSNSESELMAEEYSPPGFNKKAFLEILNFCTGDKYDFLHINKRVAFSERYRKNLDEIIELDKIDQDFFSKKKTSAKYFHQKPKTGKDEPEKCSEGDPGLGGCGDDSQKTSGEPAKKRRKADNTEGQSR